MKKLILILALLLAGMTAAEAHRHYRGWHTISMQTFYEELSPYGEWNYTPQYGYVWSPWADEYPDFTPYSTGGNWVYTDLGWTWASDYRWGWAPFHYGRWTFDDRLGWCWVPGYEWAPAWVTWGTYDNCYAWAPLGPDVYVGVNTAWFAPASWWTVVPYRHFCGDDWHNYVWNRPVVVNNITCITNIYNNYGNDRGRGYDRRNDTRGWYHGPRVNEVERVAGVRVKRMEVVETGRPGRTGVRNDRVEVYRPEVRNERGSVTPRTTGDPGLRQLPPEREVRERPAPAEYTRTERQEQPATVRENTPPVRETRPPVRETRPPVRETMPPVRETVPPVREAKPPVRSEVREAVREAEGRTRETVRQAPPATERSRPVPRVEPARENTGKRNDIGSASAREEPKRQNDRPASTAREGRR